MSPFDQHDRVAPIVYVVDDDKSIRTGLSRFLKSHNYRHKTFSSGSEFLNAARAEGQACLILDLQMPEMSGIELQKHLVDANERLPIIFLTAQGDVSSSVKAMKQGAVDFLPKMADRKELLNAIESALQMSAELNREAKAAESARFAAASLTDRETEVCQFVIGGMLNKQIAAKLEIAERTVKAHRAKVMEKFGARSLPHLVRLAERAGISAPE